MKVYNINEITDSKIMYDRKPPAFMKYIILIVTALIIAGLVWANNSVKTYVVKGQGLVTTDNKSYIMTKTSGEIKEVFIEEGSEVKAGDVLFTMNSMETDLQLDQVNAQIEIYNRRIELLRRAEENATKGTNDFDKNHAEEKEFYNKLTSAYLARKEYEYVKSECTNKDESHDHSEDNDDEEYKNYLDRERQKHYYSTVEEFTNEKVQFEGEIKKLQAQKDALEKSTEQYKVKATKDGVIHIDSSIKPGMVIQGGLLIGSVTGKEDELVVDLMLPSTERPRIHIGNEVELSIGGLNQTEYGTINGEVVTIAEDATIDNEKGDVYFKVKIKPNGTSLEDSKGEKVNLVVGMVAETRVKYEKITYLKYLLELIGIKFN